MTTMTAPSADVPTDVPTGPPRSRRNRDELETLAANFVNSRIHVAPAPPARLSKPVLAAGAALGLIVLAVLAWMLWPAAEAEPVREAAPAVHEAAQWTKRIEAERERKRQELARSAEYLQKMAAADGALVSEMTQRAQQLAARVEQPATARATDEPTPKGAEPAARGSAAAPAPAAQPPADAPQQQVASAGPAPAAASGDARAPAAPTQVAQAANCKIHVSELSASGKLTYADVARMKGARTDARGNVYTPPVAASGYRAVVFEVHPNGCVDIVRSSIQR
jgi:hypothetical protein